MNDRDIRTLLKTLKGIESALKEIATKMPDIVFHDDTAINEIDPYFAVNPEELKGNE